MIQEHHAVVYHGQSKEEIKEQHLANRAILKAQSRPNKIKS